MRTRPSCKIWPTIQHAVITSVFLILWSAGHLGCVLGGGEHKQWCDYRKMFLVSHFARALVYRAGPANPPVLQANNFVNRYHEFTMSFAKGVGMAKWIKWNIWVEHEVIFLLLSLLWGLSEDVLYLDNYAMRYCFLKYWYVCGLYSIFFGIFVSDLHILSIKLLLLYKVYAFPFAQKLSARPSKAEKSHRSLSEAIWFWENKENRFWTL